MSDIVDDAAELISKCFGEYIEVIPQREIMNGFAMLPGLVADIKRLRGAPKSGLYGKYIIQKADGSPVDPKADYFILRLDTDPIARRAALEYSYYQEWGGNRKLAKDLQNRIAKYDPKLVEQLAAKDIELPEIFGEDKK